MHDRPRFLSNTATYKNVSTYKRSRLFQVITDFRPVNDFFDRLHWPPRSGAYYESLPWISRSLPLDFTPRIGIDPPRRLRRTPRKLRSKDSWGLFFSLSLFLSPLHSPSLDMYKHKCAHVWRIARVSRKFQRYFCKKAASRDSF